MRASVLRTEYQPPATGIARALTPKKLESARGSVAQVSKMDI